MTFTPNRTRHRISSQIRPALVINNLPCFLTPQFKNRGWPVSLASLAKIEPFSPTGVALADVAKTGLGSSAALITSLVTALLLQTGLIASDQLASASSRLLAHNVAQFVHCLAQGKVGSGFDVSAAVFGSQLYTRFSPAVLQPLMDDSVRASLSALPLNLVLCLSLLQTGSQSLLSALAPENHAWDLTVTPFTLPPRTRLLLADIHAGSNTPLLVSQVLRWRSENSAIGESPRLIGSSPIAHILLTLDITYSSLALDRP
jgi:phosphomevalonate kinase